MKEEIFRDKFGSVVGRTEIHGDKIYIYDRYSSMLGYYDGRFTYNKHNSRIGEGNLLVVFISSYLKYTD